MAYRRRTLLLLWVVVIAVTTTIPWSGLQGLQGHSHWSNVRWIPFYAYSSFLRFILDIAVNLLLFVPFGYLYVRSQVTMPSAVFLRVTLLAALLAAGVELVRVFSHTRIPSTTDICSNIIGAVIGATIARKVSKERPEVFRELDGVRSD
ncbi:MAG TPA: VanZ family protein [Nitrospiraceae bacterium]|nr:VanZ family protein [Nitrospiraceae bacterium]